MWSGLEGCTLQTFILNRGRGGGRGRGKKPLNNGNYMGAREGGEARDAAELRAKVRDGDFEL